MAVIEVLRLTSTHSVAHLEVSWLPYNYGSKILETVEGRPYRVLFQLKISFKGLRRRGLRVPDH